MTCGVTRSRAGALKMRPKPLTALTILLLAGGCQDRVERASAGHGTPTPQAAQPDTVWQRAHEQKLLTRLRNATLGPVRCDFAVNAGESVSSFPVGNEGKTTVVLFWRPTCRYCEPALRDLSRLNDEGLANVAIVAAAETKSSEAVESTLQAIGGVSIPVCGYSERQQTRHFGDGGVPLTLVFNPRGHVSRIAAGSESVATLADELRNGWRAQ